jgi:hypothetical protein
MPQRIDWLMVTLFQGWSGLMKGMSTPFDLFIALPDPIPISHKCPPYFLMLFSPSFLRSFLMRPCRVQATKALTTLLSLGCGAPFYTASF